MQLASFSLVPQSTSVEELIAKAQKLAEASNLRLSASDFDSAPIIEDGNSVYSFVMPERGNLGTILAHSWHKFGTNDSAIL
jgi:hypothetical protein